MMTPHDLENLDMSDAFAVSDGLDGFPETPTRTVVDDVRDHLGRCLLYTSPSPRDRG